MAFNPDDYLKEKQTFNPDSYLDEKQTVVEEAVTPEPEQPTIDMGKEELPDDNTQDWGLPNIEDLKQFFPEKEQPVTKYNPETSDLEAGFDSLHKQVGAWATGMARGIAQTVVGTPEGVAVSGLKALPVVGPMAEPMTRMFMKAVDRLIPGSRQKIINAVPLLNLTDKVQQKLAQPTDIEIEAEDDFKKNMTEALQAYGLGGQIAYGAASMAWRLAGTVLLAETVMGKGTAPSSGIRSAISETGVGMTPMEAIKSTMKEQTLKGAAKFGAFVYGTKPGTPEEKAKAAAVAVAYSYSPLIASGARTDSLAKLFTVAMNTGVSILSGSYNESIAQAKAIATTRGEDWNKIGLVKQAQYFATVVTPQVVADIVMGIGAKSIPAAERLMRDKTIRAVHILMGKSPEQVIEEMKVNQPVPVEPKLSQEQRNQKAQDLLDRKLAEPSPVPLEPASSKQSPLPTKEVASPASGLSDLQQSLTEAKTHDIANTVIDIASESPKHWPEMQKLYWQKVRDGEISKPKGSPSKKTIVDALKDNWMPEKPLSPADVARNEASLPSYLRRWGGAVKSSVVRLSEHVTRIKDAISKSVLSNQNQRGFTPGEESIEKPTRAESLNAGIDRAMEELSKMEFAPEELNDILDGMAKGKNKVAGVGESAVEILKLAWAAETPEQAISMINTARAARGRPVITDIAATIRGGEPLAIKKPFNLSQESRTVIFDSVPSKLKQSPEGPQAIQDAIDALPFELPQDQQARQNVIRTVVKNAYEIAKARREGRNGAEIAWEKTKATLRVLDSARYWINSIYNRTGDYQFLKNDNLADRLAVQKEYEHHIESERILNQEGVPHDLIAYLRSNKELDYAVMDVLGLDPIKENNTDILDNANKIINSDKRAKDVRKFISALETSFRNTGAIETRATQIIKFSTFWDKYGSRIVEGEAGKGDKVALAKLLELEKKVLPKFINEETGEVESISRDKAMEGVRIYKEKGIQALVDYESTQTYGSRRFYWPTEFKPEPESFDFTTKDGLDVFDIDGMLGLNQKAPPLEGASKSREMDTVTKSGENRLDKSSTSYNIWYRHMRNLKVQLWTYDLMNKLAESLNKHIQDGTIGPEEAKLYALRLRNIWGKPQNIDKGTKFLIAANSLFWKTYFLSLGRIAWFGGRNIMQGSIFGLIHGQYKSGDIFGAYPKFLYQLTDKNSNLKNAIATDFQQRINQSKAYFNEAMMLSAPGERQYVGKLMDAMAGIAGVTDTASRFFVYGPGYVITEGYANKLIQGKITQGKFEDALLFNTMSEGDAMRVREMMENAKDKNGRFTREGLEPVIREIAGIKNANVNFLYRTSERGMLEQRTSWRPWLGILSFARGSADALYWNGVKPLADGLSMYYKTGDIGNLKAATNGAKNILKQYAAYTAVSLVMSYLFGEKRDIESKDKKKTIPGQGMLGALSWSPLSPGITKSYNIGKDIYDFFEALTILSTYDFGEALTILSTGDTNTFKKAMKITGTKLANDLLYLSMIGSDLANIAEATNNKAMVSNVEALMNFKSIWRRDLPVGVDADRTLVESFIHAIFGTKEFGDKRNPWQRISDSNAFGEAKRKGENVRDKYKRMRPKQ